MFLMRMTASSRIVVAEQLTRDGLADHGDFGGAIHVAFVEKAALGDLPVANLLELRRDSLRQSAPIQISRHHLFLTPEDRRRKRHRPQLTRHRLGIAVEKRVDVAEAGSDAALHVAAGQYDQDVGAKRGDLRANGRLGAFADGDHGDDRADADDDTEHRQESAQLVSRQRAQRNSAVSSIPASNAPPGRRTCSLRLSEVTRPSRNTIWRLACAAMSTSWVTRIIEIP